jgi:hypothetical protein
MVHGPASVSRFVDEEIATAPRVYSPSEMLYLGNLSRSGQKKADVSGSRQEQKKADPVPEGPRGR